MKCRSLLFVFFSLFVVELFAQKPPIDTAAFKKWPDLGTPSISNDGRFVFYTIHNNEFNVDTLVLQSTDAKWKMNVIGAKTYPVSFTADSKKVIYINKQDSLCIQELGKSPAIHIANVASFTAVQEGMGEWLIYQSKGSEGELVAYSLKTDKQRVFTGVVGHLLSGDGKVLVVQKQVGGGQSLEWVTLGDGNVKEVWKGDNASNLMFDNVGKQLAFLTSAVDCKYCGPSLWCYNSSAGKVNRIIEDKSAETDSTMQIDRIQGFSKDGERVFVYLKEMKEIERRPIPDAIQINVWSYRDIRLQSQQLKEINETRNYLSVINIKNRNVIRLEDKNEISRRINDDYILIIHYLSDAHSSEFRWNKAFKRTQYLVSTKSGERKYLDSFKDYNVNISTNGKFLIFYDAEKKDYLCYEIESGIIRNLTRGIDTKWTAYQSYALRNVAAWLEDDQAVLIYDEFDIWQVDPKNIRKPINVTNHYGKSKSIIFFLPYESNDRPIDLLNEGILTAFNPLNKSNGFYSVKKGYKQDPKMLVMEDYVFDVERVISGILAIPGGVSFKPIGSGSGNAYIVKRSSATEFPNYFSTHDFKEFISLSNIHPEKAYNWYSTELHTWKTINGDTLQGILYKPENFDSLKRYPIIFYYYDKRSDGLNAYWKPDYLTNASVTNIPYYVSNGYLMVGFDIKYRTGEIGKSVLESAISAARYFSNKPFINQGKMGINGYSHGGYETYYLVAHTSLFAAASGGGGIVDLISFYGSLKDNSYSAQEMGQMDLGNVTLWERPDLYIKNSPIFKADQVSTPLLMMHTTYDGAVDIHQAIEFFTALRSLGKKVWLLEYEDGNHGLYGKSQIDYSKRMMQFFDLYLKDKPAPKWMLDGIPAKLKGIDTGLELDTTGRIPGPGLTNNPECITEQ